MNLVRVIPVLLLADEGLVKTTKFKDRRYIGDPINAVKIFNEKEADELCLLDINATKQGKQPNYKKIEEIVSEAFMPITYGGGVSSLEHFESLFNLGVEKVSVNSCLFDNPSVVCDAANLYGSQSIVASIDLKKDIFGKYRVVSHCGQKKQKKTFEEMIELLKDLDCGECIINSVNNDGCMKGYDLKALKYFCKNLRIPVVSMGGAGSLNHFKESIQAGSSAVGAGSFFIYQGKRKAILISYPSEKEIYELSAKA